MIDNSRGETQDDAQLIAAFQAKITIIKDATRQVEAGGMPDIGVLEGEVDALCKQALTCGPDAVRSLRALMAILIDSLETLARRIKEHHDGKTV